MDYLLKAENQTAIQRARFTTQDPSVDSTITNMVSNSNIKNKIDLCDSHCLVFRSSATCMYLSCRDSPYFWNHSGDDLNFKASLEQSLSPKANLFYLDFRLTFVTIFKNCS